jgi:decaprenyl-phosphate phosphoribosyltransferase
MKQPRHHRGIWPYLEVARPDHWVKNVFMILGVLLAFFYQPEAPSPRLAGSLALALAAVCLVASSNYALNELLDGPTDRAHPVKRHRPVPSGRVSPPLVVLEWLLLAAGGLALAALVNWPFAAAALGLWLMGIVYNVPPLRTKEWPYLDVLTESMNNPFRLLLGWFVVIPGRVPPVSLTLAYWMLGAFFMAVKRLAEYRRFADAESAAAYRRSFGHYTVERLLVGIVFYATVSALFAGIFIVRYRLELILAVPLLAGLFAFYLRMGFKPDSAAEHPERLHRESGLILYLATCLAVVIVLMLTDLPFLYRWFRVEPIAVSPLWTIGR